MTPVERETEAPSVTLFLDEAELRILNNALNEICNGADIEDFEFASRIGGDRRQALALLERVGSLIDELTSSEK